MPNNTFLNFLTLLFLFLAFIRWGTLARPLTLSSCLQHLGLPWFLTFLWGSIQHTRHFPYLHDSVLTNSEQDSIFFVQVHVHYAMFHLVELGQGLAVLI